MSSSNAGIEVDLVRPDALTPADVAEWHALRVPDPVLRNPLFGPGFAQAVGRARDDAMVAIYRKGGHVVGILAHHRRPGGLGRPIGAPFSDYHGLITHPEVELDGRMALSLAGLKAFRHIGLYDPRSAFQPMQSGMLGHAIVLTESPEDYLERLRAAQAKKFKNWRRLRNRLQEIGTLRLAASTDQADYDQVMHWKRDQFTRTGAQDVLHPEWVSQMMQGLFEQRQGEVQGLMLTLHAGDRLVAGHFGIREEDIYHPWIASVDPELAHASPGQAYLWHAVMAMPELGLETYDLGTGHDHYKRPFSNVERTTWIGSTLVNGTRSPAPGPVPIEKLRRRLDHIASTELTLAGRAHGLMQAALALRHRSLLTDTPSDQ